MARCGRERSADARWSSRCRTRGIEFFFAQFVDLYGAAEREARARPRETSTTWSRTAPGFAGFAAGEIGQVPSDPDIAAMPDLDSFTPVPWQPNLARFACDVTVEGEAWPYCPRTILRRELARAQELGYEFKIGLELEYFLVQQREDGSIEIADAHDTLEKPCYDMAGLTRQYDFLTTVSQLLQRARLGELRQRPRGRERPVRAELHLRRRARQLRPRDLLPLHGPHARRAARDDRDLHAEAVHAPDRQRLPLPHVALARRREPLPRRGRPARARPLGDGVPLHRRPEGARARLSALTAPTVNSYKRLKLGSTASGATWSPVWISYGYNNRTQMLRIPAPGRIEDRTIDGSANPYLAAAAVLAAGLDGIERGLDAGEPNSENLYASTLRGARARSGCDALPGEPARGDRRARARRRPADGARPRARRGLRRLLRARQARRVVPLPRAGHAVGDPRVPDALLQGIEKPLHTPRDKSGGCSGSYATGYGETSWS